MAGPTCVGEFPDGYGYYSTSSSGDLAFVVPMNMAGLKVGQYLLVHVHTEIPRNPSPDINTFISEVDAMMVAACPGLTKIAGSEQYRQTGQDDDWLAQAWGKFLDGSEPFLAPGPGDPVHSNTEDPVSGHVYCPVDAGGDVDTEPPYYGEWVNLLMLATLWEGVTAVEAASYVLPADDPTFANSTVPTPALDPSWGEDTTTVYVSTVHGNGNVGYTWHDYTQAEYDAAHGEGYYAPEYGWRSQMRNPSGGIIDHGSKGFGGPASRLYNQTGAAYAGGDEWKESSFNDNEYGFGSVVIALAGDQDTPTCKDAGPLGCLPPGLLWEGNTPWDNYGSLYWSIVDNAAQMEAPDYGVGNQSQTGNEYDGGGAVIVARPDGPHQTPNAWRLKVKYVRNNQDPNGIRVVKWQWRGCTWEAVDMAGFVELNFGDGLDNVHGSPPLPDPTIRVGGSTAVVDSATVPFDPYGKDVWVVVDFRNGTTKAKVYEVGTVEPGWMVSTPTTPGSSESSQVTLSGLVMSSDTLIVDSIDVGGYPASGTTVVNALVGIGNGVNNAFYMPGPMVDGSAVIRVDGITTEPISWGVDETYGLTYFVLDRPADKGARITATYSTP